MTAAASAPSRPNFAASPGIPKDDDGVVFAAPWEAKAFALVIDLQQRGGFHWQEWVTALSSEIAADAADTPYYELWLAAAEKLIQSKGLVTSQALASTQIALRAAQSADDHDPDHDHDHDHDHGAH